MRKILFAVIAILFFQVAHSQDLLNSNVRHYPGKVKYQKEEQDATIFEIPYPKDEVEVGLRKMAEARGVKVREKNGFYSAENAPVKEGGGGRPLDFSEAEC